MRAPFILFRRTDGAAGGKAYYVAFWDPQKGDYAGRRSVGSLLAEIPREIEASPTSKAGATLIAQEWLRTHEPAAVGPRDALAYLEAFWAPDGAYAQGKKIRDEPLAGQYLYNSACRIRKHVKPYLEARGKIPLGRITPGLLEGLVLHLVKSGASARTINSVLQAISVPLAEAVRLGTLASNPVSRVQKLPEDELVREVFTNKEAKEFFALEWADPRVFGAQVIAATTGLRLGEVRGLQAGDLEGDVLHVCHNWEDRDGLKGPKGSKGKRKIKTRTIPVPPKTATIINELAGRNPWADGFVLFGDSKGRPISKKEIEDGFAAGCEAIGITEKKREERGLGFHAWRHWYNSNLRGAISDPVLRALTGHSSAKMTDHYFEVTAEQRTAVAKLAAGLVQLAKPSKG